MRIILWGINYAPEVTGIAPFNRELCDYLAGCGHDVAAVTTFSYYPQWRKRPEDSGRWQRVDRVGNVDVHRCWHYVPQKVTTLKRIAHELSFCLTSFWRVLRLKRADVYFVVSPPLALGFFAWLATRIKGSRFVFHVQDLQPDAAVGLGMLKPGMMVRVLYALEALAYRKAAKVSGISKGMHATFLAKNVPAERVVLLPNWLRGGMTAQRDPQARARARARLGIPEDTLLAVYSGNLGRKQGLDVMYEAAAELAKDEASATTRRVQLLVAGDGAGRDDLERRLADGPLKGLRLLPLLSNAEYEELLAATDVSLITQAAGTGQYFFPSKLLSSLAVRLPVIAVADETSELAQAVAEGGFGRTVPPGNGKSLAAELRRITDNAAQLDTWGTKTAWVEQFAPEKILPRYQEVLTGLVP